MIFREEKVWGEGDWEVWVGVVRGDGMGGDGMGDSR